MSKDVGLVFKLIAMPLTWVWIAAKLKRKAKEWGRKAD